MRPPNFSKLHLHLFTISLCAMETVNYRGRICSQTIIETFDRTRLLILRQISKIIRGALTGDLSGYANSTHSLTNWKLLCNGVYTARSVSVASDTQLYP